jgi:hypothetical protein
MDSNLAETVLTEVSVNFNSMEFRNIRTLLVNTPGTGFNFFIER